MATQAHRRFLYLPPQSIRHVRQDDLALSDNLGLLCVCRYSSALYLRRFPADTNWITVHSRKFSASYHVKKTTDHEAQLRGRISLVQRTRLSRTVGYCWYVRNYTVLDLHSTGYYSIQPNSCLGTLGQEMAYIHTGLPVLIV